MQMEVCGAAVSAARRQAGACTTKFMLKGSAPSGMSSSTVIMTFSNNLRLKEAVTIS
jgi:hypothetical protein